MIELILGVFGFFIFIVLVIIYIKVALTIGKIEENIIDIKNILTRIADRK
jgi:hypothetical protein